MINFDFVSPTKIYFGKDKELKIAEICNEFHSKRVFIVIGKGSVKSSGLLTKVTSLLDSNDIAYYVLEGVRANPTIELCRDGILKCREFNPDLILAIGGGSVIDTAKNIAAGYYYDGDSFDFHLHISNVEKALPIGVILTIAASGSELSNSCVIQNDSTGIKRGFNSDLVRPVFAIENPELTYTLSKEQTAYGIVDTLMHTLERYLQPSSDNEPADGFAETVIKSVIKAGEILIENPKDYESRAVLMLMSSFSHNGLTHIGKTFMMPVHQLEHALSGIYPHVAHAAGLALIYSSWATFYLTYDANKFAKLGRNVFDLKGDNDFEVGNKSISLLQSFFLKLEMPYKFEDLNIENVDIERLVNLVTNNKTKSIPHHCKPMDDSVVKLIFEDIKRR